MKLGIMKAGQIVNTKKNSKVKDNCFLKWYALKLELYTLSVPKYILYVYDVVFIISQENQ